MSAPALQPGDRVTAPVMGGRAAVVQAVSPDMPARGDATVYARLDDGTPVAFLASALAPARTGSAP